LGGPEASSGHEGVPEYLRGILSEDDENVLIGRLAKCSSYPEYQTIVFRLAQLREEHAVAGLLSSADYKKAKVAAAAAEERVRVAHESLNAAETQKEWEPTEDARRSIEQRIFGETWRADVAEEALAGNPEYAGLLSQLDDLQNRPKRKKVSGTDKEIAAIEKKLRLVLIRKGPLSPEAKELQALKNQLKQGASEAAPEVDPTAEIQAKIQALQKELLGERIEDDNGALYSGGSLDLEQALTEYRMDQEAELEIAIGEEKLKHKFSGNAMERAELARAERDYDEGHYALQVHEAAIRRAKLRALKARSRTLVFEPQKVDTSFVKTLKEQPKQLRALFVEDSMFRDHLANLAWDGKEYELTAEVDKGVNETSFKKALKDAGGKETTYQLNSPANYHSWASKELGDIQSLKIKNKDTSLMYTPRTGKKTPHSEQGQLRLRGKDPEKLLKQLEDLKMHKGVCSDVPYEAIYRGQYRYGQVTPLYEPLESGRAALDMPDGHMVLHGLTGVSGDSSATSHFSKIVKSGGLKSIAERRRMGISGMTMSPLGDIASGIDMGVPCKIGDKSNYGSAIFFGMHPEALNRRDLWFADRDFGGGHNRYPEYAAYAKTLGQKDLHDPCPVDGRAKHLKSGLQRADNEVYFKGEISWNDVDTLFVQASIGEQIRQQVTQFQQQGLLPPHIRVAVTGQAPVTVKKPKKSKKPKKEQVQHMGGWTVTEDGSVVLVGETEDEATKDKAWNVNDHIQYRSRELARTME
jgi:hypothetical protein